MAQIITQDEFEEKVLKAEGPVLVDFFADWCGPCRMMAPVLDELSTEKAGQLSIYKINIDQNPDVTSQYNVMSIPNMILFKDGQVAANVIGSMSKEELWSKLEASL